MSKEYLFCEKYRPKTIGECILPADIEKIFNDFVTKGDFPNMIFYGSAGIGKTSVARALGNDLNMDILFVNGSEDRGIDTIRTRMRDFSSIRSIENNSKLIIIDEVENLTPAAQESLKTFIEEFKNVRFIMTCNHKNKIIDPIHSRTTVVDFTTPQEEVNVLIARFTKSVFTILKGESVEFDPKVVISVVKSNFPDFRKTLNDLQKFSSGGTIDIGVLGNYVDKNITDLINHLKNKDFSNVRQWSADNAHMDIATFFRDAYSELVKHIKEDSIPELFILISQYQYQSAFAMVQEINTTAFLAELYRKINFK